MKTQMLIRASEQTKQMLTQIAKERGQTVNSLVNQILWEWLHKNFKGE